MKVLTKAKVYLVSRQVFDFDAFNEFLKDEGVEHVTDDAALDGDFIPEVAGRVCYMSFGSKAGRRTNIEYLKHILESGHGSVCEHTVFGFLITGISRSLTHELVRHRQGVAYSQLSQRYVDSADSNVIIPPALRQMPETVQKDLLEGVTEHQRKSLQLYDEATDKIAEQYATPEKLVDFAVREGVLVRDNTVTGITAYYLETGAGEFSADQMNCTREVWVETLKANPVLRKQFVDGTKTARRKSAREAARCVLPNATETKMFFTANARALRHIFEMRGNVAAEQEIRALAVQMLELVRPEAPHIFQDMTVVALPDGTSKIESAHRKV